MSLVHAGPQHKRMNPPPTTGLRCHEATSDSLPETTRIPRFIAPALRRQWRSSSGSHDNCHFSPNPVQPFSVPKSHAPKLAISAPASEVAPGPS